ncbi:MAG TPA: HEPN domain-containing protein, partial [Anaerolineae bacterium]|nr:HEPN domain-containing protein [Anaerolineae bacterium]
TVYYIDTRYPGLGPSFGEDVAKEAIELASEALEFVERKMV